MAQLALYGFQDVKKRNHFEQCNKIVGIFSYPASDYDPHGIFNEVRNCRSNLNPFYKCRGNSFQHGERLKRDPFINQELLFQGCHPSNNSKKPPYKHLLMITSNQLRFRGGQMVVRSITFRMMRSRLLSKSNVKRLLSTPSFTK